MPNNDNVTTCTYKRAQSYFNTGFNIIPIPKGGKSPVMKDWQNFQITQDTLKTYFGFGDPNIALLTGSSSNGIVDVDIDHPLAVRVARALLPKTGYSYGRKTNPMSHYFYRLTGNNFKTIQFSTKDHGTIIELRGDKCCSNLPGSLHPSGEIYETDKDGDIEEIPRTDLLKAAALVLYTTFLALEWPTKGSRHNTALGYVGFLCKAGYSEEEVRIAIKEICAITQDEEIQDRLETVKTTYTKFKAGELIAGLALIENSIGEHVSNQLKKWSAKVNPQETIKSSIDELIENFNQKYAVVQIGGKSKILEERTSAITGEHELYYSEISAFRQYHQNNKIAIEYKKTGEPIENCVASIWLKHPQRRSYEDVLFDPSEKINNEKYYNLWQGFSFTPDKTTTCDLFLSHLKNIVCLKDEEHYKWLLGWMADIVQNPSEKPGTAVVLRGSKGTGKSLIGQYFGGLFGKHFFTASQSKHLFGNFNAHLEYCIFLLAEEAFWAGTKEGEGVLKELITGPKLMIEQKGIDVRQAKNHVRLMITSNEDWVVPASELERRFFVLDLSNEHVQDPKYFSPIWNEMENGGRSALLNFLLDYKYEEINLRKPPITEGLMEQQIEGLDSLGKFLFTCLLKGRMYTATDSEWPEYITTDHFCRIYKETIQDFGLKDKSMKTMIGMGLAKYLGGSVTKSRLTLPRLNPSSGIALTDNSIDKLVIKAQQTVYQLPSLEECRTLFKKHTGIKLESFLEDKTKSKKSIIIIPKKKIPPD